MTQISVKNDISVDQALAAMATYPTLGMARDYLKEQGLDTTIKQLRTWRDIKYPERYQKLKAEIAPKLEAELANEMLDNAGFATMVERTAIEKTAERLQRDEVEDPSRVARDLSQVRTQAIDKRLALEGRPQKITESRNIDELVRALEGMGVAERVTIDSTAIEDDATDGD